MSNISKPEANPIAAALLCLVFGIGHMVINGQQRKWIYTLIAGFIGSLLCGIPGLVVGILSLVDAYKTAERLKAGQSIGENEYSVELLHKIVSILDKTATFQRA